MWVPGRGTIWAGRGVEPGRRSSAKSSSVDVVILGAGTAGLSARRALQKAGATFRMVDPGPFGTTCARVGCMPSKLFIAAADAAHRARSAAKFGVRTGEIQIDGRAVFERVRRERDRFVGFVNEVIDDVRDEGNLVQGRAKLTGPTAVTVDDGTELKFRSLVIATGTQPFIPPPFRGLDRLILTREQIFEQEDLPESLLVVGLGAIGLELGQAFHRLGVRTTLLGQGGSVGPLRDPDVLADAHAVLGAELDLHPSYLLSGVEAAKDSLRITFQDSRGRAREEHFQKILIAAGARPALGSLGLQALGVEPDDKGRFPIDPQTLQLGDLPIFVAGDANGLHPLLHEATDDGAIAGANAARHPELSSTERRARLSIVFSDPQIAIVGGGFPNAREVDAESGEVSYANQGRARVMGENAGSVRIYAHRDTGRLVGAELFAPGAERLAHLLAWAVQAELRVEDALAMPFYHPVLEEGLKTALRDLAAKLKRGAPVECKVSELGVGA